MANETQLKQVADSAPGKGSELTLETIIYLIFGIFLLLLGAFLFWINTGELPYNMDSTYGLLLVIVSLQVITLGKTPLGEFRRSWLLVIIGMCTAIVGTVACLIPGLLSGVVTILISGIMIIGGVTLLLQLVFDKEKARRWIAVPGILQHLTVACVFVYLMEIIVGVITLFPGLTTVPLTAVLCIIFGISLFYLAWCIQKVAITYPQNAIPVPESTGTADAKSGYLLFREVSPSTSIILLLMMGIIIMIVAILMVPFILGIIPFSSDGQMGLLLVIMALQVLALGETPLGVRNRSWLLILAGMVFAGFGMVSCIVPGLLTGIMLILLGLWNLIAGGVGMVNLVLPIIQGIRYPPAEPVPVSSFIIKFLITLTLLQIATILFGVNMLVPDLLPGLLVLGLLFFMGIVIIVMAFLQMLAPAPE